MNPTGLEALRYVLDNGLDEYWVTTPEGEAAVKVVKAMFLTPQEAPCATCNDDPAVCATVPGLRHCEKATRDE